VTAAVVRKKKVEWSVSTLGGGLVKIGTAVGKPVGTAHLTTSSKNASETYRRRLKDIELAEQLIEQVSLLHLSPEVGTH
jgi:hypothetical protein